jgi:predicted enzyme related to lactoylglutathione lyase
VLRGRLAFPVDDIDQKVEKIAKRGFRVLMPVTEVGGNPFAVTGDPFGNVVALYTPFAS